MQQTVDTQLQQVVNMLARRRWLILTTGLLGATLAWAVGLLIPTGFTAKSQIVIDPQQISLTSGSTGSALPVNDLAIETQVAMLSSRDHLRHVRESLLAEPEFQVPAARPEQGAVSTAAANAIKRSQAAGVEIPSVDELEAGLKTYQESGSRVIAVTFTSTSPQQAAVIANQLARMHVASTADLKKAETGSASFEQELEYLQHQLSIAKSDLAGRQTQLAALQELQHRSGGRDEFIAALNSSVVSELVLSELRQYEIAQLQSQGEPSTATAKTPTAQAPAANFQELRHQIDREADGIMGQLAHETQIAAARVRSLEERMGTVEGARRQVRELEVARPPLQRKAAVVDEDPYVSMLHRQQREMREQPEISPGMHILAVAEAPEWPSTTNPILFVLPAFVAFSIAGGLLATVLEGLDRRLRSARDVEDALSIACIGLVPPLGRLSTARVREYLIQRPCAPYTEAIRSVVTTALQLAAAPPQPKVFLITSSIPGEGETTLAVSFASFAACLQRRVILVDLAFKRPAIFVEAKGKSMPEGLDVFQGRPWKEAIQSIPDLAIDYLPLQTSSADPVALLSGTKMPQLLDQVRESYDCVVIHSDSLLSATSARLLVSMVDKVLLVVKWGCTRPEVAQNAISLLGPYLRGRDPAAIVNAVITNVSLKKHAAYRNGDAAEVLAGERINLRPVRHTVSQKNASGQRLDSNISGATTYAKP